MKNTHLSGILLSMILLTSVWQAEGKVDLVTLPNRAAVQLTIYNSEDLTLVRENRALTLNQGANVLQFSWANTLIDPTSLDLMPKAHSDAIDVMDLTYPARTRDLGMWHIISQVKGQIPVEIQYLTSGLSWRAFYMGTLSSDEAAMHLQGYVVVSNNSGEDYENAQTRLIVGKVHLIDAIAELARRTYPYGSPIPPPMAAPAARSNTARLRKAMVMDEMDMAAEGIMFAAMEPKAIEKEGLSEYFLYTIEGTETIPNGWAKRLPSFNTKDIPVENLYKYDEPRFGAVPRRFLSFKNDEEHKLGTTPIPGGIMKCYRQTQEKDRMAFEGSTSFKYIPVGEKVELDLGSATDVKVEPVLMDQGTDRYLFNHEGNITGWIRQEQWKIKMTNARSVPVRIEITRHVSADDWDIEQAGEHGTFEKLDTQTIRYHLTLAAHSKKAFDYTLQMRYGTRAD